jgi:SAM-dependent methyltransferase
VEEISRGRHAFSALGRSDAAVGSDKQLDPDRYTVIAHRDRDLMIPLSVDRVDALIDLLHLRMGGNALEIGCGKAELLMRVLLRYAVQGEGWDSSLSLIKEAHRRATQRGLLPFRLRLHVGDGSEQPVGHDSLDLIICAGSPCLYGGLHQTLETLSPTVRDGGYLLVGEHFWRRKPKAAEVKRFAMRTQDYSDLAGTVAIGESLGLTPLCATISSDEERDEYEWDLIRAVEEWAAEHPDDPERQSFLTRAHLMRDSYLTWRRDMMGFGLFLYRVG